MDIDVNEILTRYASEVAQLSQRALIAEAKAATLEKALAECRGTDEKEE